MKKPVDVSFYTDCSGRQSATASKWPAAKGNRTIFQREALELAP
jgi:hypothetical protein